MIGLLILVCEISFWIFIIVGLFLRYVLKFNKIGLFLIFMTPVIDVILLVVTVIDLKNGATPSFFHGLAAIYIGVSVSFGKNLIGWADKKFLKIIKSELTNDPVKYGKEKAKYELKMWLYHLRAFTISAVIVALIIIFVNIPDTIQVFTGVMMKWSFFLILDFIWSISYSIFPKKSR